MFKSNTPVVHHDIHTMVKDAQTILQSAATMTGDKAEEVRTRGLHMLDVVLAKVQEAQTTALTASKEMAISAEGYVKENPWRVLAAATGVALVIGAIIGRK